MPLEPLALGLLVVVLGGLVVVQPMLALGVAGVVVLLALSRLPLVWLLAGTVGITVIVPYATQQRFSIGPSAGPGLLPSDVLLLATILGAVARLRTMKLDDRTRLGIALVVTFVGLAAVQFVRGVVDHRDLSAVGYEFRVMLAIGTFLATVALMDDERDRGRLLQALAVIGLALGSWGLAQWVFNIKFSAAADAGVRSGVLLTTAGRGQLQGGLYAFPVAVLMALAVLIGGGNQSTRTRLVLVAILVLNSVCLVLTYERTFWIATAFAAAVLVVRTGAAHRARAIVWACAALLVTYAGLATLAPSTLTAARERLFSIGQYQSDFSLRYRVVESQHVFQQIRHNPIFGSGFNASIVFARPWDLVPAQVYTFSHNGYLWLAWRLGIPTAALLFGLMAWSIGRLRLRFGGDPFGSAQAGARASVLALALVCVTFPIFNQLSITATLGMLIALSVSLDVAAPRRTRPAMSQASVA